MKMPKKIEKALFEKVALPILEECHAKYIEDMDVNMPFEEFCLQIKLRLEDRKKSA